VTALLLLRLQVMVFVHYFVWGSWYVTMGTYLTNSLRFPGSEVGLAYGTFAVGAMLSPFFAGIVADRFFATQRLLGCLHLFGASILYYVSTLETFSAFYTALLIYTISYAAGHGLTNTLTLHHTKNPGKEFPIVMLLGSVGWIAAGLTVSWLQLENSAGMFRLAACAALVIGLYAFTLPNTPPKGAGAPVNVRTMLGLDALRLMRDRSFSVFIVCSFLICVPLSFYFSWINVFMNELRIPTAAAKLTIGQVSDVVFLLLLPALLLRLGVKGILLVGMGAALRVVRPVRSASRGSLDAVRRHRPPWDVLRLHLRDGPHVRRQTGDTGYSRRGARLPRVRHAWSRDVRRHLAVRRRGAVLHLERRCDARVAEHLARAGDDVGSLADPLCRGVQRHGAAGDCRNRYERMKGVRR
jgi:MFS family permease